MTTVRATKVNSGMVFVVLGARKKPLRLNSSERVNALRTAMAMWRMETLKACERRGVAGSGYAKTIDRCAFSLSADGAFVALEPWGWATETPEGTQMGNTGSTPTAFRTLVLLAICDGMGPDFTKTYEV